MENNLDVLEVVEEVEAIVENVDNAGEATEALNEIANVVEPSVLPEMVEVELPNVSEAYLQGATHAAVGLTAGYVGYKVIKNRKLIVNSIKRFKNKMGEAMTESKQEFKEAKEIKKAEKALKKAETTEVTK